MSGMNGSGPKAVLNAFSQKVRYVDFDVKNPEHIKAYICLTKYGRQHPTLRFNLSDGYLDVHSMMNAAVGAEFIKQYPDVEEEARHLVTKRS